MTENKRSVDRRLRKAYGISLAEYEYRLEKQNGGCAICHRPPKDRRLAVDHDHSFKYFKVGVIRKADGVWAAWLEYPAYYFCAASLSRPTKHEAIRAMREELKKASVRGLLCYRCNRGLKWFENSPERLVAAAVYLQAFADRNKPSVN